MGDLISRSALIENFKKSGIVDSEDDAWVYSFAIAMIESTPTVDAVPVVHGEWKVDEDVQKVMGKDNFVCSHCTTIWASSDIKNMEYCPSCGAKMDGKKVQE